MPDSFRQQHYVAIVRNVAVTGSRIKALCRRDSTLAKGVENDGES